MSTLFDFSLTSDVSSEYTHQPTYFPPSISLSLSPQPLYISPSPEHLYASLSLPARHARSTSHSSVLSSTSAASAAVSPATSVEDSCAGTPLPSSACPRRAEPAIRHHGPLLLPKIRRQDHALDLTAAAAPARRRAPAARVQKRPAQPKTPPRRDPSYLTAAAAAATSAASADASLLRADALGVPPLAMDAYAFPSAVAAYTGSADYLFPSATPAYTARARSPLAASPEPCAAAPLPSTAAAAATVPTTTLRSYLSSANPAASLVRTLAFPLRDPHTKHFWWDVRQIRPWSAFNAATITGFPGAAALLDCPVAASLLPAAAPATRHPDTEAGLHAIYAGTYLPKLNAALALWTPQPLTLRVPARTPANMAPGELVFTASAPGDAACAAALFGGNPSARVVGLVRAFDRFNTAQRVDGNIKRVEYLRGLAALHHAMREHGTRYGFILTEIELIVVRNGAEATPHFGFLEVASVQLNAGAGAGADAPADGLTACLALWGLCMMAGDEPMPGQAHWKADIGAPAEGSRCNALPRDKWMPAPQLVEKREAKRARGWILPEDPVCRKELGKRGVKYSGC